jgi:polar amino acid transport system substrate-binding protein
MRVRTLSLVALLALLCFPLVAGAQAQQSRLDDIVKAGTIKIGVFTDLEPYGYLDASGKNVGYDVDLGLEVAKRLGVKTEFVQVTGPTRVPSLVAGKVDVVIADFTRTLERSKLIAFSDPYIVVGNTYMVLAKRTELKTAGDLNKPSVKVAISRGGTSEQTVPASLPNATLVRFDNYNDILIAVRTGKADVVSEDNIFTGQQVAKAPKEWKVIPGLFSREDICFGVPKGDWTWYYWVNLFVHEINADGTNKALFKKWFKMDIMRLRPDY